MKDENYIYAEIGENYRQVTFIDGVRTTLCDNRFEIVVEPKTDLWEQQAVQNLRAWIRARQKKLRDAGDLSE